MPARTDPVAADPAIVDSTVTASLAAAESVPPGTDSAGDVGPQEADPLSVRSRLSDMSRRGFLRTGSIGVLAAGVVGSVPGLSSLLTSAEGDAPELQGAVSSVQASAPAVEADASAAAQTFSARVSNLSTGEMRVFVGNQTLRIQDPELAQRLSQAARAAQAAGR